MSPEKDIIEWIRLAELDLGIARHLFETFRPMPLEPICNHCQQSAEKILKGFLVFNEVEPPKTHKLRKLCDMCIEIKTDFYDFERELAILTRYSVFPRYPNELELEESDAETAIKYADKIKEFVKDLLDVPTKESK
jgi:HEPN domain-containing protein